MKKILALTLCVLMVLSVFSGCSRNDTPDTETTAPTETEGADPNALSIGYGRVDITPTESVPLGGSTDERISDGVADHLYATCIAFTDGTGNTVLLYHLDLLGVSDAAMMARSRIAKKTGINGMQIIIGSTHNHSGPKQKEDTHPAIERYNQAFADSLVQAAELAMADRKPVTKMYTTRTYPEGLNFVRHHILEDGSKTGWATPAVKSGVAHVADPDNEMQLVKFTREGGKDILIMNWQGHPDAARAGKLQVRSDVDIVRKELESQLDCQFAYFLGASGNMNTYSYLKGENITANYIERGKALAKYAVDAVPTFTEAKFGKIKFIYNDFKQPSKASEAVQLSIPLYAFSIGDLAFSTASYEMFKEMGELVKKESPFPMTIISTCTNGGNGYLPVSYAFEYDAYEVSSTKFVRGTAEKTAEEHIRLLNEIFNAN